MNGHVEKCSMMSIIHNSETVPYSFESKFGLDTLLVAILHPVHTSPCTHNCGPGHGIVHHVFLLLKKSFVVAGRSRQEYDAYTESALLVSLSTILVSHHPMCLAANHENLRCRAGATIVGRQPADSGVTAWRYN